MECQPGLVLDIFIFVLLKDTFGTLFNVCTFFKSIYSMHSTIWPLQSSTVETTCGFTFWFDNKNCIGDSHACSFNQVRNGTAIITYPKIPTHWLQNFCWHIMISDLALISSTTKQTILTRLQEVKWPQFLPFKLFPFILLIVGPEILRLSRCVCLS